MEHVVRGVVELDVGLEVEDDLGEDDIGINRAGSKMSGWAAEWE